MEDKKRGNKNSNRPKRIGKNRRDNNRFVEDINRESRNTQPYRSETMKNIRTESFNGTAREDMIEGRNAVIEALKSDRTIEYIMIAQGDTKGSISEVIALAKEKSVVV